MYRLLITDFPGQATNYLINGELLHLLQKIEKEVICTEHVFTLEGPIADFNRIKDDTIIVVYDWEGFFNRVIAKLPENKQKPYYIFQEKVIDLGNAV
jgi:hypothetical protein